MAETVGNEASETFATQLRRIMATTKHTPREVAEEMTRRGYKISKSYMYALLDGKSKPGHELVVGFADYFEVELAYFSNSKRGRELNAQYELLSLLGEENVKELAYRTSRLSAGKIRNVLDYIRFQESQPDQENHTSG